MYSMKHSPSFGNICISPFDHVYIVATDVFDADIDLVDYYEQLVVFVTKIVQYFNRISDMQFVIENM